MTDPIVLQSTGNVLGPASSTDNSMVLFSGTSGKVIKGNNAVVTAAGLALLDDNNNTEQRNTLGLGNMAIQNNNAVTVSGGNVTGLTSLICIGTNNAVPTPPAGDSSLKIANTAFVAANGVPVGCIVMWAGTVANIPAGWKLCNGSGTISNGMAVPNLLDRFVMGGGYSYPLHSTGGQLGHGHVSHTGGHALSVAEMPSHRHTIIIPRDRAPTSAGNAVLGDEAVYGQQFIDTEPSGGNQAHTHPSMETTLTWLLPPYYALAFIIKN